MNCEPSGEGGRSFIRGKAHVEKCVFLGTCRALFILTRSPDLGLFFGRVGKASSFGLVSMAQ